MKIIDIIILIIFITICCFMSNIAHCETIGESFTCHNIGYLATNCQKVTVLPMEYYDRDIALALAKNEGSETTNNISNYEIINQAQPVVKQDEVKVTTSFEYATDDFKGYATGYNSKEYKERSK